MGTCKCVAIAALLLAVPGLAGRNQQVIHEYVLKVEGDARVKLDMLLITKEKPNSVPQREQTTITSPYTKKFQAAKCFAWFDTLPEGKSGADGTKFPRITIFIDGKPGSACEGGVLMKTNKYTCGVGDL